MYYYYFKSNKKRQKRKQKNLVIYKFICIKEIKLVRIISIDLFLKSNNVIRQSLFQAIDLVKSSAKQKNEKKIYFTQLINQLICFLKVVNLNMGIN